MYCDIPALCKFSNFAVVQALRGKTALKAVSRIWSFFDDDKLFWSLESEHFKIYMKKNFVSGPDSALTQLPFPVQFSINSSTKCTLVSVISAWQSFVLTAP